MVASTVKEIEKLEGISTILNISASDNENMIKDEKRSIVETLKDGLIKFGFKSFYHAHNSQMNPEIFVEESACKLYMALQQNFAVEMFPELNAILSEFNARLTPALDQKESAQMCFNIAHEAIIKVGKLFHLVK